MRFASTSLKCVQQGACERGVVFHKHYVPITVVWDRGFCLSTRGMYLALPCGFSSVKRAVGDKVKSVSSKTVIRILCDSSAECDFNARTIRDLETLPLERVQQSAQTLSGVVSTHTIHADHK